MLKPQDVLVALKLTLNQGAWNYSLLSSSLGLSLGECHLCIKRLGACHLYDVETRLIIAPALHEFLLHGIRYAFPAQRTSMAVGLPTGWSALPLETEREIEATTIWPYANGNIRGEGLTPLYSSVPLAATKDARLHELLALIDVLRENNPVQKATAGRLLRERISPTNSPTQPQALAGKAPRKTPRRTAPRIQMETVQQLPPPTNDDSDSPIEGIMRRLRESP